MSMEKSKRLLEEFSPNSYEDWAKEAEASLKGKPLEKLTIKTYEGIAVKPIYRLEDAQNLEHLQNNLPGVFPFVRGTKADGYKKDAWAIEQEINYAMPEDFNTALKYDMGRGQNAVAVRFNDRIVEQLQNKQAAESCPSTILFDLEDMKKAFDGIDLKSTPVHLIVSNYPVVFFALFNSYLKSNNMTLADVKGVFRIDPLGNLARSGEIKMDIDKYYQVMALILNYLVSNKSALRAVEVDATVYNDGGANAVQEIAYALATGAEYIRGIADRNVSIDDITERMSFSMGIGSNFFMEIAKVRAFRMLWAKVAKEFGAGTEGQKVHLHTKTTKSNKTKLDQYVNMLRVTNESLAAIVAGTDSHTVRPFDDQFGLPKDFSRRISRNTQLFLKEECNLRDTIDPAGGSWYVETLTAQLAESAWKMFQDIEAKGGMAKELLAGNIQSAIATVKAERIKNIASRKDVIVGTNKYPNGSEKPADVITYDYKAVYEYAAKKSDNKNAVAVLSKVPTNGLSVELLNSLTDAFLQGTNIAAAVSVLCGSICNAEVKAEKVCTSRLAEPFEAIRAASEEVKNKTGNAPKIFFANMGPLKQHKGRADFSADFFGTGGFEIINNAGFNSNEEAAKAALESDSKIIVICSTDDTYPEIVPELAKTIKSANPNKFIVLAGYPTDYIEQFKEAGVDEFIHIKANLFGILTTVQKQLGIA